MLRRMGTTVHVADNDFEAARLSREGIEALAASGFFEMADDRIEVIDGVMVRMAPAREDHAEAHAEMAIQLGNALPSAYRVRLDLLTLFGGQDMRGPDIAVVEPEPGRGIAEADDLRLVVEIASESRSYDLGAKADFYAAHGIPELWVLDLRERRLVVHREPGPDGYGSVEAVADAASPLVAPDVTIRLSDVLP